MGVGLSMGSTIMKGMGTQSADQYQAAELDRAAQYGRLKAEQTGGQLTQRLNQTLGNIDVMRAAGHNDPSSPTGNAYRDYQESVGETQRSITVDSILADAQQKESDAAYLRQAGDFALLSGGIGAAGQGTGGLGSYFKGA